MKQKIINDPVFGFITITSELLLQLVNHPYMQRLSRIKQLGLSSYVYPGAQHTRFQHALGAMHLMSEALRVLKGKGHSITDHEFESALAAILLHDLGHGPYSHTLEHHFIQNGSHEILTERLIEELNTEMNGKLSTALKILTANYHRPFFHDLISGQLDVDRMDYLRRDSLFCGVSEGTIGSDRIIKMLDIYNEHLVVEGKGIFSIENFLIARRLMYWQVYLHKTAMVADEILIRIIERAKLLAKQGEALFGTAAFIFFINNDLQIDDLQSHSEALRQFTLLDDSDVICSLKVWCEHPDIVLSTLCRALIHRKLPKTKLLPEKMTKEQLQLLREKMAIKWNVEIEVMHNFIFEKSIGDHIYSLDQSSILFKTSKDTIKDITVISDIISPEMLKKGSTKNYLCTLKQEHFI